MTAEIAILNKQGVALAADSAVTISDGNGTHKIYNSVNKLFALSKKYPVGIMVYNVGSFMGIPWETLIKHYRATHLKDRSFPTLCEYYLDFMKYLAQTQLITDEDEREYFKRAIHGYLTGLKTEAENFLRRNPAPPGVDPQLLRNQLLAHHIQKFIEERETRKDDVPVDETERLVAFEAYRDELSKLIVHIFAGYDLTEELVNDLIKACIKILGSDTHVQDYSGIVITGFGEAEKFPSLYSCTIECRLKGIFVTRDEKQTQISNTVPAVITPYADRQMVDMFMTGINPQIQSSLFGSFNTAIKSIPEKIQSVLCVNPTEEQKKEIQTIVSQASYSIQQQHMGVLKYEFIKPLLTLVALLPLDEITTMAKTLINLASFKRKISVGPETVGGPIDIAVISKGDGFVWIERKHYFPKELNSDFYERRYGGQS